ncbi:heterokaryon incompatibility protein-domain-containing protein [Boeremia exigua]|uniref:heterokaryon incompatibility protein-domain-containing protein n=1 Tax=Boeremia exigua TaxID=749465 RepID=UPI001E8D19A0|nr:heterokaryon incompatibility protein-domain-containing protein [Boeremia exigua]KAH6613025.1 heterokaryon incompatibility protein-domain-containing protein [Boeremia exigua]
MQPSLLQSMQCPESLDRDRRILYPTQLAACDIRLLSLLPSEKDDDPVQCELRQYEAAVAPEYEALSYVWGKASDLVNIKCNQLDVLVTRNLRDALLAIRDPREPRTVWADALCMNQADVKEKNIHVPLMGRVYSQTSNTVIYLGGASHEDATAAETGLMTIFTLLEDHRVRAGFSDDDDHLIILLLQILPDHSPISVSWSAIKDFFDQSWFVRIWCVQEVVLAQATRLQSYAIYGHKRIPYHYIRRVALFLAIAADCQPELVQNIPFRRSLASISALPHVLAREDALLSLLNNFRPYSATDSRDMVYGLLGILSKLSSFDSASISVDYTKTVAEVYTDIAVEIIRVSQDLEILNHVSHPEILGPELDFPSWVPRWDRARTALGFSSSDETRFKLSFPASLRGDEKALSYYRVEGGKLFAYGTCYNEVKSVLSLVGPEMAISTTRFWKDGRGTQMLCCDSQQQSLMIARTLTAGYLGFPFGFSEGTEEKRNQFLADFLDYIHNIMSKCSTNCSSTVKGAQFCMTSDHATYIGSRSRYTEELAKMCKGRLLFRLANGSWGIGPDCMREGDIIVALFGGFAPYALRHEQQECRFLGPVYIDGLMDGQYFRSAYNKSMQEQDFILV